MHGAKLRKRLETAKEILDFLRLTSKYLCSLADGYRRKKQEKHFLMFVALL